MKIIITMIFSILSILVSNYLTLYLIKKYPEYDMDKKYRYLINVLSVLFYGVIQFKLNKLFETHQINTAIQLIYIMMMSVMAGVISSSFIIDCLFKELPDENNFLIGLMILPISIYFNGYSVIITSLILFVSFFVFALITGQLGMGDVKMLFFMGFGFIPGKILSYVYVTFFITCIYCIFKLIKSKFKKNQTIAFGPFLIIGFLITIL